MSQGPNKFKNYRLRWLSKPLRLAKFEFLWIEHNGCFGIPDDISLSFTTFSEFLTEFSQWFYYDSLLLNASSMLAASPFYSVILGFQGITDSFPLFPWVLEPMSCQPLWWPIPSLFSQNFFLLIPFPQKLLADFPF